MNYGKLAFATSLMTLVLVSMIGAVVLLDRIEEKKNGAESEVGGTATPTADALGTAIARGTEIPLGDCGEWVDTAGSAGRIWVPCESTDDATPQSGGNNVYCDPPLTQYPCPQLWSAARIEIALDDAWRVFRDGLPLRPPRVALFDYHPFLADFENKNDPQLFRDAWPFPSSIESQMFACGPFSSFPTRMIPSNNVTGTLACQHIRARFSGNGGNFLQCDRAEPGALLCWSIWDRAPELSAETVICSPVPMLNPGNLFDYWAACAPY